MAKQSGPKHPFAQMIGLHIDALKDGHCLAHLDVHEGLYNPNGVLHGGVLFSLADTCMGAAVFSRLEKNETCATIEIKINFLKPVAEGRIDCDTKVMRKGRTTAVLESRLTCGEDLLGLALGTYAVMPRRKDRETETFSP